MIFHCVYCNFKDSVSSTQRREIFQELAAFSRTLVGVEGFDFGPNRNYEKKSQDYSDGFIIRFQDRDALERYACHPTHLKLGQALCDLCHDGADGIMVFDLEAV